jgi:BASS family bile acid:Na+ symporter
MTAALGIKILTTASLTGLLLATGLRLTFAEVNAALRDHRMLWRLLLVNFGVVPALTLVTVLALRLPGELAAGMLILAAAPFAPVVPVFSKMCRADLALAAGLTGTVPFLSAFLTPLLCALCFRLLPGNTRLDFNFFTLLAVLAVTVTLPLAAGLAVSHWRPALGRRLLRPMEILSEAIGALSLAFVTLVEARAILGTGWVALLGMVGLFELSLWLGYGSGGSTVAARRVLALGTGNRNIALALLIAAGNFAASPILGAVVANGLLLILLGLLHTAWWRWRSGAGQGINLPPGSAAGR